MVVVVLAAGVDIDLGRLFLQDGGGYALTSRGFRNVGPIHGKRRRLDKLSPTVAQLSKPVLITAEVGAAVCIKMASVPAPARRRVI